MKLTFMLMNEWMNEWELLCLDALQCFEHIYIRYWFKSYYSNLKSSRSHTQHTLCFTQYLTCQYFCLAQLLINSMYSLFSILRIELLKAIDLKFIQIRYSGSGIRSDSDTYIYEENEFYSVNTYIRSVRRYIQVKY